MENNNVNNVQEQDFSELLQIRRDKLAALRESGNDPFVITKYDVTAYSASVKAAFEENEEAFDEAAEEHYAMTRPTSRHLHSNKK